MLLDSKPYTFDRVVRIAIFAALVWGAISLMSYLSDVLIPFAVALLIAYLMNPFVCLIQRKVPNRLLAVLISLFLSVLVLVLIGIIVFPAVIGEVSRMGKMLSDLITTSKLTEAASKRLPPDLWEAVKQFAASSTVQDFFKSDDFLKITQTVMTKIFPGLWGVISGTASLFFWVIGLSIVVLYMIFLLLDFEKLSKNWEKMIPPKYRESIVDFISEFRNAMGRYFRGQATVAFIVGILFAFGFWLIGLPLGILLGLVIGLLNMVPYLQIVGVIPALLLACMHALDTGSSFWVVISLTSMVFVVVQTIQDTILVPKIMGKVTGLSPVFILLSLSIWGKLLGLLGLLIALPVTCLIFAYYKRYLINAEMQMNST